MSNLTINFPKNQEKPIKISSIKLNHILSHRKTRFNKLKILKFN